jgi:hypothetical protein
MSAMMGFVVLGTSIWMAADAAQLDYDKRDVRGLAAMGPVSWMFAGLLLWIVAFPLYLLKRNELKAAGQRRRQLMAAGGTPNALPTSGLGAPHGIMGASPGQFMSPHPPQPFTPAPPPQPAPLPQPAAPSSPTSIDDAVKQIHKLDELRRAGILTDAEFQHKKTEILART